MVLLKAVVGFGEVLKPDVGVFFAGACGGGGTSGNDRGTGEAGLARVVSTAEVVVSTVVVVVVFYSTGFGFLRFASGGPFGFSFIQSSSFYEEDEIFCAVVSPGPGPFGTSATHHQDVGVHFALPSMLFHFAFAYHQKKRSLHVNDSFLLSTATATLSFLKISSVVLFLPPEVGAAAFAFHKEGHVHGHHNFFGVGAAAFEELTTTLDALFQNEEEEEDEEDEDEDDTHVVVVPRTLR